jgi:hypothetical protein
LTLIYIHNFRHALSPDFNATMATAEGTTKNSSNDWAFVTDYIQGSDADSDGNFADDTMLCFSKHGTLALTFHANFNSGIICAPCGRQFHVG